MAAPVTQSITYQGMLTNAAGTPLMGTYTVTFKLYEVSSGGSALATDTHSVQASKGVFTTQITAASSFFDGRALWLGITVGADAEMTPRQEIQPVPFSLSMRPGAKIVGSFPGFILDVINNGGSFSPALHAKTMNTNSPGLIAETTGTFSPALMANTTNTSSSGVYSITTGTFSPAVNGNTTNTNSPGVYLITTGAFSPGVAAKTMNTNSPGVQTETTGSNSPGVVAFANGPFSNGVVGHAYGINGSGVVAISEQSSAIWAQTNRSDNKYGLQTPNLIRALGYETGASDIAEYMPITGDVTSGTVLVIGADGKLQTSTTAYDTRVAGIVSTAPGISLGARERGNPGEALIAVAGRVPCKVDASNGPIHPGDVLTTSDNPGYAMKAIPVDIGGVEIYKPSTVLGKAMGSLENGTGTIEVLVTLQ